MTATDPAITIRDLVSLEDYDACVALQDDTWGHGFAERVPGAILRVAQKIGGVAAGAFDSTGRIVGFVFGMTGVRNGILVHWSDMLAVRPEARGGSLGLQLKQFQRDAVQRVGVETMLWSADPLVARNAHFNINRLGAMPMEYVENMYGANTGSVLHGAMPTDRFVYHWSMTHDDQGVQRTGLPDDGDHAIPSAITRTIDGTPSAVPTAEAPQVRVPLPNDLSDVQSASTDFALAWRIAVRSAFATHLRCGYVVTRFVRGEHDRLPYYVLSITR